MQKKELNAETYLTATMVLFIEEVSTTLPSILGIRVRVYNHHTYPVTSTKQIQT